MSLPTRAIVDAALAEYLDPETGRSALSLGQISDIKISGEQLSLTLGLTTHSALIWQDARAELASLLKSRVPGVSQIDIHVVSHDRPPQKQGEIGLPAKSIIAVGSGKGGVGKSTIAASLAIGLARGGSKVGLLDADVYGPSIPHLMGVVQRAELENGKIRAVETAGLKLMSMGFLVPPGEAVVWRGPMLHGAIMQMLRDTNWGDMDYMIIDMPPGTGDIALTLSQILPLTGAVVVCTPQDVALLDAVKAIAMFRKVNIPILGIVENMSYFQCPGCDKRYDIFGSGGARRKATELDVPFLGEVPLQIPIREHGDQGRTAANFDDAASVGYLEAIAKTLVKNLAAKNRQAPPMPSLPVL